MHQKLARQRSTNFKPEEESLLVELTAKYLHILELKKCSVSIIASKRRAWEEIGKQFNARNAVFRSIKVLKGKYENRKKKVKADLLKLEKQNTEQQNNSVMKNDIKEEEMSDYTNDELHDDFDSDKMPTEQTLKSNSPTRKETEGSISLEQWTSSKDELLEIRKKCFLEEHDLKMEELRLRIEEQKLKVEERKLMLQQQSLLLAFATQENEIKLNRLKYQ